MEILIIISFFFFLSLAEWITAKIIQAGIIGNIAVGIIYGVPLANILEMDWQKTFLSLGYVGLILIIFEGPSSSFFPSFLCLFFFILFRLVSDRIFSFDSVNS